MEKILVSLLFPSPNYSVLESIDVNMDRIVLDEKSLLRCSDYLSLLNWIGFLTLSLLLKLPLRKLEP